MYFIGIGSAIHKVRNLAFFATQDKDMSMIIPGKNGTGKEIVARIILYSNMRRKELFYQVNSADILRQYSKLKDPIL